MVDDPNRQLASKFGSEFWSSWPQRIGFSVVSKRALEIFSASL